MKIFKFIILATLLFGCSDINTSNPDQVFYHWMGTKPSKEIQLIKGQYWQSAHFTKEYIVYLHCKPTDKWWNNFIKQNNLIEEKSEWTQSTDTPDWFMPNDSAMQYKRDISFDQGSRYFRDKLTGECFI